MIQRFVHSLITQFLTHSIAVMKKNRQLAERETIFSFPGGTCPREEGHSRTVDRMTLKSTRRVLSYLRLHLLICSYRSLALLARCASHSLTHSGAHGKEVTVCEINASISHNFSPLCTANINSLSPIFDANPQRL